MKKSYKIITTILLLALALISVLSFAACDNGGESPTSYTITYNLDGGTNHPDNPDSYTSESPLITLKNPTKSGYIFIRWEEGNTIPTGSSENKTFTAVWVENTPTSGLAFNPISGGYSVSKGTANTSGIVVIPAQYNNLPIKEIAFEGFRGCQSMTGIIIPDSVSTIVNSAFRDCGNLLYITLPDNVSSIGNYAFLDCTSIINFTIPNSVTFMGENVFSNCTSLASITIPDSLSSINIGTFKNCSSLTNIIIPDSVSDIKIEAFYNCTSLTNITIPNSVKTIESSAFYNCTSLTNITIPNSLETIESGSFSNCTSLTNVIIPNGVKTIESSAFKSCSSFTSIIIPNSVTIIGYEAFADCSNLTSITLSTNLTDIGNESFRNCSKLKDIIIPNSVNTIGDSAFSGCIGLIYMTIPSNVIYIGNSAFSDCTGLLSITLPNINLGANLFNNCSNVTIYAESINPHSLNDSWNFSGHTVVWSCMLSQDKTYVESFTKTIDNIQNSLSSNTIKAPNREGYTFKEWNTNPNGTGAAYGGAIISTVQNGTTLFAIWELKPAT